MVQVQVRPLPTHIERVDRAGKSRVAELVTDSGAPVPGIHPTSSYFAELNPVGGRDVWVE
jgi:hypothetical protein